MPRNERDDRDEDDEPRPAKRKPPRDEDEEAPRARKGAPRDDEDERPARKRRPRDEDEADDYDDAPQGRPRKGGKKGGGAIAHVIPYKNGWALAAYYCGVAAWIPILCFIMGPIAFFLGLVGFFKALKSEKKYGIGHAIFGIVCGILMPILWVVLWYTVFEKMTREGA